MSAIYLCLLFDADQSVTAMESIVGELHTVHQQALAWALASDPATKYELWSGGKRIGSVPNKFAHAAAIVDGATGPDGLGAEQAPARDKQH